MGVYNGLLAMLENGRVFVLQFVRRKIAIVLGLALALLWLEHLMRRWHFLTDDVGLSHFLWVRRGFGEASIGLTVEQRACLIPQWH